MEIAKSKEKTQKIKKVHHESCSFYWPKQVTRPAQSQHGRDCKVTRLMATKKPLIEANDAFS